MGGHFYPATHHKTPRAEFTLQCWISLQRHTPIYSWWTNHLFLWVRKNNVLNTEGLNAAQRYRILDSNTWELYQEPHRTCKHNKNRFLCTEEATKRRAGEKKSPQQPTLLCGSLEHCLSYPFANADNSVSFAKTVMVLDGTRYLLYYCYTCSWVLTSKKNQMSIIYNTFYSTPPNCEHSILDRSTRSSWFYI